MKPIMSIDELQKLVMPFRQRIEKIKLSNPPADFTWYGYDILNNIGALGGLLTGKNREIFDSLVGKHLADIGAADGDLRFFLETFGIKPHIIDYGPTNWNGLKGAKRLKELLQSNVEIHEIDLDSQFRLPFEQY